MNVTRRSNMQRMNADRQKEFQREDLIKKVRTDEMLIANMMSNERVENKRMTRCIQQSNRDAETHRHLQDTVALRQERQRHFEQEERLAGELERRKNAKLCEEKFRQKVRENSHELRALEEKLKAAYMNRERSAQIAERRALNAAEKQMELELVKRLDDEWKKYFCKEEEDEQAKAEKSVAYKAELEKQLEEIERKKQEEYEEFLKEKIVVEEVVRKIAEEDNNEMQETMRKQQETRCYIDDFMKKREEWKEEERIRQEEEDNRIKEYARMQSQREEAQSSQKKAIMNQRQDLYDRLAREMASKEAEAEEMVNIRTELYAEEQEALERKKDAARIARLETQRSNLQEAHRLQLEQKAARARAEVEQETMFREEMARKFQEDERHERAKEDERRARALAHKRDVEHLLNYRNDMQNKQKELEREERLMEERFETYRQAIIEQERERLLKEHAGKLVGHLPKGVLRDDQDLTLFSDEFQRQFMISRKDPWNDDAPS